MTECPSRTRGRWCAWSSRLAAPVLLMLLGTPAGAAQPNAATMAVELTSSDPALTAGFAWAKQQAAAYVFEGDPVGPWFEAALPRREAFCMRDTAHQANGAHFLGLALHTKNMLRRFAENVSRSRDWCSYWEIDRQNRPSPADYASDADFWYNLPANFDVLDACHRMYLLTGDEDYVRDPVFLNFYDRTVEDYLRHWKLDPSEVMGRPRAMHERPTPSPRFQGAWGIPGYDEGDPGYRVGLDLLGAEHAAFQAYAHIQERRGNMARAAQFRRKAEAVKALVNGTWWDRETRTFKLFMGPDGTLGGRCGLEVLYRDLAAEGAPVQGALATTLEAIRKEPSPYLVEVQSHQPEVLYRYGQADVATAQLLDLCRPDRKRREYPEVSFSVVGAVATGLMGVSVPPTPRGEGMLRTLPALGHVAWAELAHLPVRGHEVTLRHEGGGRSTLKNLLGGSLAWQACFEGDHDTLWVDGRPFKAHHEALSAGRKASWVRILLAPGQQVVVQTSPR